MLKWSSQGINNHGEGSSESTANTSMPFSEREPMLRAAGSSSRDRMNAVTKNISSETSETKAQAPLSEEIEKTSTSEKVLRRVFGSEKALGSDPESSVPGVELTRYFQQTN